MEKVKVKMKNENMDEENAKEEENLKGLQLENKQAGLSPIIMA